MLDLVYVLVTIIPLPFWFLMIFLPKRAITRRATSNYLVFLVMGVLYIFMLVGAFAAGLDSASKGGPGIDFSSASGLARFMSLPAVALGVWTHMITMDLLGGHWLYHEAQRLGAPTLFTSITLFVAFFFAPLAVFVFILWRSLVAMRGHAAARQSDQPA
jgi:ABA4-like protein